MRVLLVALFMVLASHVGAQEAEKPALKGKPVTAPRQQQGAPASEQDTAPEPDGTTNLLSAVRGIEAAIRELIAEEDKIEGERQKQREIADLDAQQDMARWAKLMFWATAATVFVAGVGIAYVRKTLMETRRLGMIQMRAYIGLVDHEYIDGDPPKYTVDFKNTGQTPARRVRFIVEWTNERPLGKLQFRDGEYTQTELAAGSPITFSIEMTDMTGEAKAAFMHAGMKIWLQGFVEYYDVFGERRETSCQYRLWCSSTHGNVIVHSAVDSVGNAST